MALKLSIMPANMMPSREEREVDAERRRRTTSAVLGGAEILIFQATFGHLCARAVGGRRQGYEDGDGRRVVVRRIWRSKARRARTDMVRWYCEGHFPAKHRRLFVSLAGMFVAAAAAWACAPGRMPLRPGSGQAFAPTGVEAGASTHEGAGASVHQGDAA